MICLRPDIVTAKNPAGRWRSTCLTCMDGSMASFHRPVAEDWRRAHIAQANTATRPQETR